MFRGRPFVPRFHRYGEASRDGGPDGADDVEQHLRPVYADAIATALWALAHGLGFLHLDGKFPAESREDVAARVSASFDAILRAHTGDGHRSGDA